MKTKYVKLIFALYLYCLSFNVISAQTFTKITAGSVVNDFGQSKGVTWIDFDADHDLDLFVTNAYNQNNYLYSNDGSGTFVKILSSPLVSDGKRGGGSTWADIDNDGDFDVFVANNRNENNELYINQGNGIFSRITSSIVVSDGGYSNDAVWSDFNNDGFVDLFVTNGDADANGYDTYQNFLYMNNGNGDFTKITSGDIVTEYQDSQGCAVCDYDNDGDIDIFVTNHSDENNCLYQNIGDGTFNKITSGDIVNDGGKSNGASWADLNNDGYLDLFVANGFNQNNFLYKNNGDGTFLKITSGNIVNDGNYSVGSSCGDYNNDSFLDIFVTNTADNNNFLYINTGNFNFSKVTHGNIVSDGGYSYGTSNGDYNNDGFLDIFVANSYNQNNFLYLNNGNGNNWININCKGTYFSNRSALGTILKAKAIINGNNTWQTREISSHTGHKGQNSLNVEFGLGDATIIDSLVVYWPTSNTIQVLTNVAVNQFLTILEEYTYLLADFIADTTLGEFPLTVQFSDFSTTNDTIAINTWEWDFNNDDTTDSYDQNPTWIYSEGGSYSVRLIVSNGQLSDTLIKKNYINVISENPLLTSIEDIPNDQGGWVKVNFVRSLYDTDSLQGNKLKAELYTVEIGDSIGWMAVNSTGAYGKNVYSILAHTPIDSSYHSNGQLPFRVIAFMDEGNFVSNNLTGYSKDNIAPSVPSGLYAALLPNSNVQLKWNLSDAIDFENFNIYRSQDENFIPSYVNLIASIQDTAFIDSQIEPGNSYYYSISAKDINGNESGFSTKISVNILSSITEARRIPKKFNLFQNFPNPFNPNTTIIYELPKSVNVKIEVFNLLGQKINTLVNKFKPAGTYNVEFIAKNLPSGVYLYRINAGEFQKIKKMIILK